MSGTTVLPKGNAAAVVVLLPVETVVDGFPPDTHHEAGKSDPAFSRWLAIKHVLEQGGVMFIDTDSEAGPGVRLRKPTVPPLSPEAPSQDVG